MSRHITPLPDDSWDRFGNPRPINATLAAWLMGLLAVAMFFGVIHLAERDADFSSRMAQVNAELDAAEASLQRAAAQLCRAEVGPGAEVLWTQDGDLVCRPARMTALNTPSTTSDQP